MRDDGPTEAEITNWDEHNDHADGDDYRAEGPPDGWHESLLPDLDELQAAHGWAQIDPSDAEGTPLGEHGAAVWRAIPDLIEELRAARERLAHLDQLDTRMEYALTGTMSEEPGDKPNLVGPAGADDAIGQMGVWSRVVRVDEWARHSLPPF